MFASQARSAADIRRESPLSTEKPPKPPAGASKKAGRKPSEPKALVRDEADTFISEVSEELRKDRLNRAFKKYGPYAAAAIFALVLGAGVNEWMKSQSEASARSAGLLLAAAGEAQDAAEAYGEARSELSGEAEAVAALAQAASLVEAGKAADAATLYGQISARADLPDTYTQLAALRAVMAEIDTAPVEGLLGQLAPLTAEGAPYRTLALELEAGLKLGAGDAEGARESLEVLLEDPTAPGGVRRRAMELQQSLGPVPGANTGTTLIDDAASEAGDGADG